MKHYSAKYPSISDYQSSLSFIRILFIIPVLAIIFFLSGYEEMTLNLVLRFISSCSFFCLILLILRVTHKTNILIMKIEKVLNENSTLAKKGGKYKEHLLLGNTKYNFRRNENILRFILIIVILILFFISINIKQENGKLFLLCIAVPFLYYWLKNIFRFFYEIDNSCSPVISKDKEFMKISSIETMIVDWGKYQKIWKRLSSVIAFLIIFTSLSIFTNQTYQILAIASFSLINLIISVLMVKDIDEIIKLNLKKMGAYDEYSKIKLNLIFVQAPPPPGSMEELMAGFNEFNNQELKMPTFKKLLDKIANISNNIIMRLSAVKKK